MEFDTAREYLKTLWVQRELAEHSRMMLYTGLSAILLVTIGIFTYCNLPQAGVGFPRPVIVVVVSVVLAITLLPLLVLLAYIGRIDLVAQRTAAFGPFISQDEYRDRNWRTEHASSFVIAQTAMSFGISGVLSLWR